MTIPTNHDDTIYSAHVDEAIEAMENDSEISGEEVTKLVLLKSFAEQGEDATGEWSYGVTAIRDSYFRTYAQELAEDCGMIPDNAVWPARCIDWDMAARELQMDYTSIEFDGVTYWVQ